MKIGKMEFTATHGSGLQPSNLAFGPILGRCPRLVWHRAFGPFEKMIALAPPTFAQSSAPTAQHHTSPGHLSQGFTPGWYAMPRWSNFSSPNGAKHISPGHLSQGFTPGWYAMLRWSNFFSPKGAKHTSPGHRPGSTVPHIPKP